MKPQEPIPQNLTIRCSQHSEASEFKLLKRHNIQPNDAGEILWHIANFTPDMDPFKVILAFTRAFDSWQAAMDQIAPVGRLIKFVSSSSFKDSHIHIMFLNPGQTKQKITCTDGTLIEFIHKWPFDGNGGIVAHVPPDKPDIYLDEGENWGEMFRWEGDTFFAPLMESATHEIGHCLDLDHTDKGDDLMSPFADGKTRIITDDTMKGLVASGWGQKKLIQLNKLPAAATVQTPIGDPVLIALKYYGIKEVAGPGNHKEIIAMIKGMFPNALNDGDVPWCSIFMNFIMKEAGLPFTGSGMAKSWLKWGRPVKWEDRRLGDVAVFWRGTPTSGSGHVAFYINDKDLEGKYLRVLGGNQSDTLNIAAYGRERLIELRRHE